MTLRVHPFDDGTPAAPEGSIYFPIEFSLIREHFGALLRPEMEHPKTFNLEAPCLLRQISEFFSSIHASHDSAIDTHNAYRLEGTQYGVYLRSYDLGGNRLWSNDNDIWFGQDIFITRDVNLRQKIADLSERVGQVIGFMNPHSPDVRFDGDVRPSISTLRVLNHNWQAIVEQIVRGANWVVMALDRESSGTAFELDLLDKLNLNARTILVADSDTDQNVGAFYRVLDSEDIESLSGHATNLANDAFLQSNGVEDLSDFPCHVLDRNLEMAQGQFEHGSLVGAKYEHFLPSSLASNWNVMAEHFPSMVARWQQAEKMFAENQSPGNQELASIMYQAVFSYVASSTLERYREISMSIATIGSAHHAITRDEDFIANCFDQAALYASWSEEPKSSDYYRQTAAKIRVDGKSDH